MKFRVDGLGFFGGSQHDTLEEARNNIYDKKGRKGNITVEMAENEYMEILRQKNFADQKIISLQRELGSTQTENKNLTSEINSLNNQLSRAKENITNTKKLLDNKQQKIAQLENDINTLNKYVPRSEIKIGTEEITYNPYACGLTFHKITPAPKKKIKTVTLTERSQILMNHISHCPAMTSLSVERLLGCGRKSARGILKKMWLGEYLECVECLTETSTFKLYYLPGSGIEIKTANQVCHLAVLSLLYATLVININTFKNLSFKINKSSFGVRVRGKLSGQELYTALLSFTHTKKQNDKIIEKPHEFTVMPFRKNEKLVDIYNTKGIGFYIFPLKNIQEAEKILGCQCAYTIDDNLIKNNLVKNVYFKK